MNHLLWRGTTMNTTSKPNMPAKPTSNQSRYPTIQTNRGAVHIELMYKHIASNRPTSLDNRLTTLPGDEHSSAAWLSRSAFNVFSTIITSLETIKTEYGDSVRYWQLHHIFSYSWNKKSIVRGHVRSVFFFIKKWSSLIGKLPFDRSYWRRQP